MFAPQIVAIKLPTLKHLLIRPLALLLLWTSHISSHMIAIFKLGNTLITQGFEVREILLKIWLFFKMDLIMLALMEMLVFSIRYGIPIIFG